MGTEEHGHSGCTSWGRLACAA